MAKILIIYEPVSQKWLISKLIETMRARGLDIDAFNLRYQFYHSGRKVTHLAKLVAYIPKNRTTVFLLSKLLYDAILKSVQKDFDAIDVHYFSDTYVRFLKKMGKPYKITTWGSDFYRESQKCLEKKRSVYLNAKNIQVETSTVSKDMVAYEPGLKEKIRICNFGVDILDEIDRLLSNRYTEKFLKCPDDSIVVTCGYNGTSAQQHLMIIEQIKKLSDEAKRKIYLCIPATYGLTGSYGADLEVKLKETGVKYVIIKNRLSEIDLAKLRLETDVVINMQTSDSLSSSLLQHLYAGNILLLGEWLPTETYNEHNIFFQQVSEQSLAGHLQSVINNLESLKKRCAINHDIIGTFATWKSVETRQEAIYKELLS